MKPEITEHFADTGETIVREMTDEEYAQHLIDQQNNEKTPADEAPASDDAGAPSTDAG